MEKEFKSAPRPTRLVPIWVAARTEEVEEREPKDEEARAPEMHEPRGETNPKKKEQHTTRKDQRRSKEGRDGPQEESPTRQDRRRSQAQLPTKFLCVLLLHALGRLALRGRPRRSPGLQ